MSGDLDGGVAIEGLDEFLDNLNRLPDAFHPEVLERAGKRALLAFLDRARDLAPVDDASETPKRPYAKLRNSLIIGTRLNDSQRKILRKVGKNYVEVYAGANTAFDSIAHLIEFGHLIVGPLKMGPNKRGSRLVKKRGTGKVLGFVPPNPFMRRAWASTQDEVLKRAAVELEKILSSAVVRRKMR